MEHIETHSAAFLIQGLPQAYADYFYLSGKLQQGDTTENLNTRDAVVLDRVKDILSTLHSAAQRQDLRAECDTCQQLGHYLETLDLLAPAECLYQRCLRLAAIEHLQTSEFDAVASLGNIYQRQGNLGAAETFHEKQVAVALDGKSQEDVKAARDMVVEVFWRRSEVCERQDDLDGAVEILRKSATYAQEAKDDRLIALTSLKLGLLLARKGDAQGALENLELFLELTPDLESLELQCQASCAIAKCQRDRGNVTGAIMCLEGFLEKVNKRCPEQQIQACCCLGVILHFSHKVEEAILYLEKMFDTTRSSGDRTVQSLARLNLGIVRATVTFEEYLKVVKGDFPALLLWKNVRLPIASPALQLTPEGTQ